MCRCNSIPLTPDLTLPYFTRAAVSPARTSNGLPVTAYLVLGVLAANDEQLTAGEIKLRAEMSVGHFYWSPSVSHVRARTEQAVGAGDGQ